MAAYRPPGRSNRSGRSQTDNDVFEGLPVKQWGLSFTRVSMAPPRAEPVVATNDKWAELPMPRDFQMLQPWTQHLLRLARSGKLPNKRKAGSDATDKQNQDEDAARETRKHDLDDRGYSTKKWKPVPEALLEPEHKHFEFLAKRRRGLASLYGPDGYDTGPVPMRSTKVKRANAIGQFFVYNVQVPEGQSIDGELPPNLTEEEIAALPPIAIVGPGTVIEGLGVANDEGVFIAEHLKPINSMPRRNRPPPKKKGGPGRGKKRVTFTNPDGSTYTTIVPNATKIVPQPGQTVKHVAKGEEATADVSKEEAAKLAAQRAENQDDDGDDEEGDDDDDGDDDGEDEDDGDNDDEGHGQGDDDREDGEISDEGRSGSNATPAVTTPTPSLPNIRAPTTDGLDSNPNEDVVLEPTTTDPIVDEVKKEDVEQGDDDLSKPGPVDVQDTEMTDAAPPKHDRDASSSPELPLAKGSHSRQPSVAEPTSAEVAEGSHSRQPSVTEPTSTEDKPSLEKGDHDEPEMTAPKLASNVEDLLGNLQKQLDDQKEDDPA